MTNQGQSFRLKIKRNIAFTLVELLLVVVLIGVMASIAVPNFGKSYQSILQRHCVNNIAYLMRYAQSRAITQNNKVLFFYDSPSRSYYLKQLTIGAGEEEGYRRIKGRWGRSFEMPDGVEITSTPEAVTFYPDGQMDKARWDICSHKKCFTISTQDLKGRILVYDQVNPE